MNTAALRSKRSNEEDGRSLQFSCHTAEMRIAYIAVSVNFSLGIHQ